MTHQHINSIQFTLFCFDICLTFCSRFGVSFHCFEKWVVFAKYNDCGPATRMGYSRGVAPRLQTKATLYAHSSATGHYQKENYTLRPFSSRPRADSPLAGRTYILSNNASFLTYSTHRIWYISAALFGYHRHPHSPCAHIDPRQTF